MRDPHEGSRGSPRDHSGIPWGCRTLLHGALTLLRRVAFTRVPSSGKHPRFPCTKLRNGIILLSFYPTRSFSIPTSHILQPVFSSSLSARALLPCHHLAPFFSSKPGLRQDDDRERGEMEKGQEGARLTVTACRICRLCLRTRLPPPSLLVLQLLSIEPRRRAPPISHMTLFFSVRLRALSLSTH